MALEKGRVVRVCVTDSFQYPLFFAWLCRVQNADDGSPSYKNTMPFATTHDLMVSHLDHQFTSMDLDAENATATTSTSVTPPQIHARTRTAATTSQHQQHRTRQQQQSSGRVHAHTRHHSSDEDSSSGGSKPRARHKYVNKKGGGDLTKRF